MLRRLCRLAVAVSLGGAALISAAAPASAQGVAYEIDADAVIGWDRGYPVRALTHQMLAEQDVLDLQALRIVDISDLDGDGAPDALIEVVHGGTLRQLDFWRILNNGDGGFDVRPLPFSTASGGGRWRMERERFEGAEVAVITTDERIQRWSLGDPEPRMVFDQARPPVPTLISGPDDHSFEPRSIFAFDLNGDGAPEEVWCQNIGWRAIMDCGVRSGDQRIELVSDAVYCTRIGVLAAVTAGWRDLLCDRDDVFRFDVETGAYRAQPYP